MLSFLTDPVPAHISRADLLTNLLAYIPLGYLLVAAIGLRWAAGSVVIAILFGSTLSFAVESTQAFLPSRTSSKIDLLTNIAGTLLGALIGLAFRSENALRANLRRLRGAWFDPGEPVNIALWAALLWTGSQLSPFVPSMDVSSIREGLSPLKDGILHTNSLSFFKVATYACDLAGLGLLISVVGRQHRRMRLAFLALSAIVLCFKPLIVTRQLGLESVCGLGIAAVLLLAIPRVKAVQTLFAMAFILVGFSTSELSAVPGGGWHTFNWVPFAGQLDETVSGFASILEAAWPFVALASLSILGFGRKRAPMLYLGGSLMAIVFGLEWIQTGIEGRYGDVTTVLLAALSWICPWIYVFISQPTPTYAAPSGRRRPRITYTSLPLDSEKRRIGASTRD
jgi:hypothetical protein